MPPSRLQLPRTPVSELVEDLREVAALNAEMLDDIPAHETTEGEAAQLVEEFVEALTKIADGASEPAIIASAALSLSAPLKPIGTPEDTIRDLLRPRRR